MAVRIDLSSVGSFAEAVRLVVAKPSSALDEPGTNPAPAPPLHGAKLQRLIDARIRERGSEDNTSPT
ncbi:hypothetical protein AB0D04_36830 [Streptomyces sp. NPDC048483]|uniref:hypothetical protein n=1 Tax=Streptomyces sp. NPDC048483 TaxID=3154927 RepID=UPI0034121303